MSEQEQQQEQYIPCNVCGGPACAGQGRFAVCNEYCDNVAKRFTEYEQRIALLEAENRALRKKVAAAAKCPWANLHTPPQEQDSHE